MAQICTLSDIEEIERVPLVERQLPESTYDAISAEHADLAGPSCSGLFSRWRALSRVCPGDLPPAFRGGFTRSRTCSLSLGWDRTMLSHCSCPICRRRILLSGAQKRPDCESGQSAAGSWPDRCYSAGSTHEGLDCVGTAARLGHLGESGGYPPTGAQSQHRDSGARCTRPGE